MAGQRMKWIGIAALAIWSVACSQTDAGITTAVKSKLAADDQVKAYQIDVDTKDKIVTLSGAVDTSAAKTRAAEIARTQKGVVDVVDNVTVTAAGPMPMSDADTTVTVAVNAKLAGETTLSERRIDIETLDGVVTLKGELRSQAEKDTALKLARETSGVREVNDRLVVVPR